MNAEFFLDTNVLAYAFNSSAEAKKLRSRQIMASEDWVVSWQVIQEFANLALHRFAVPMKPADLADYTELVLCPRCTVLPGLFLPASDTFALHDAGPVL